MDINNNTNISNTIAQSISKLNLSSAKRAFTSSKNETNKQEEEKIEEVSLVEEAPPKKNEIDVQDIQKYADYMGEKLTTDDINYGLMYGRSVIIDYSV